MADEEQKDNLRHKVTTLVDQLFARIGKLTKVQRILVCVAAIGLLGGGYYYFIFAPKAQVLSKVQKELKTQEQQLDIYKIKARSLKKVKKQMAQVQQEFDLAMKALPDKKELPSLLRGVSKAGGNAGLKFLLFQPETVVDKEFYKEIPLSMTVSGTYGQAADFFFQVASLNRIVNINDLSISIDKQNKGRISMKCSAVTYMFAEQAEGEKGKKSRKAKKGKKR
jgi:type IV pilus assembly protein PilO